ncbi:MAG TPA: tetratricopeptide repeat protein, partial [Phaeodactylibacter sp.]|nr:tetratricopeptide repeat protein [Phaeodactylibacter sp.]
QLKTSLSTNATRTEEGASVSAEGGGRGSAHPPFYEKLGVALIQLGRLEEARESFLYALALDPMRPVALNNLGYIAALEGRYERAEERYLEALRIEPDYARALLNLAAVYLQTGRKAEARSALLRCLALEPDMAEAQMAWERFFE